MTTEIVRKQIQKSIAIAYMCAKIDEERDSIAGILDQGQFFVFVPEAIEPAVLLDLGAGGIFYGSLQIPDQPLDVSRTLARHIVKNWPDIGRCVYFQDPFTKETRHPKNGSGLVAVGEYQYYRIELLHNTQIDLMETLIKKYRCAWRFEALLLTSSHKSGSFRDLLPLISSIVVDAYDGESFLLWERKC
jgi:hypothetical protein